MNTLSSQTYPLGLVVEGGAGVQRHGLVILHGQVVTGLLQMRHLHEEARHQRLTNVDVILRRGKVRADERHLEALHDARQLHAHL